MPRVSAWLVRSSLVCLAAGATLGAVLLVQKGGWWAPAGGGWLRVHRELLIVGWLVQLALGVGFWILPPVRGGAVRKRPAWTVAGLLNGGVLLFVVGALAGGSAVAAWMLAAGRALEAAAVAGFGVPLMRRAWR